MCGSKLISNRRRGLREIRTVFGMRASIAVALRLTPLRWSVGVGCVGAVGSAGCNVGGGEGASMPSLAGPRTGCVLGPPSSIDSALPARGKAPREKYRFRVSGVGRRRWRKGCCRECLCWSRVRGPDAGQWASCEQWKGNSKLSEKVSPGCSTERWLQSCWRFVGQGRPPSKTAEGV